MAINSEALLFDLEDRHAHMDARPWRTPPTLHGPKQSWHCFDVQHAYARRLHKFRSAVSSDSSTDCNYVLMKAAAHRMERDGDIGSTNKSKKKDPFMVARRHEAFLTMVRQVDRAASNVRRQRSPSPQRGDVTSTSPNPTLLFSSSPFDHTTHTNVTTSYHSPPSAIHRVSLPPMTGGGGGDEESSFLWDEKGMSSKTLSFARSPKTPTLQVGRPRSALASSSPSVGPPRRPQSACSSISVEHRPSPNNATMARRSSRRFEKVIQSKPPTAVQRTLADIIAETSIPIHEHLLGVERDEDDLKELQSSQRTEESVVSSGGTTPTTVPSDVSARLWKAGRLPHQKKHVDHNHHHQHHHEFVGETGEDGGVVEAIHRLPEPYIAGGVSGLAQSANQKLMETLKMLW